MFHRLTTSERAPTRLRWSRYNMLALITLCLDVAAWHDELVRAINAQARNKATRSLPHLELAVGAMAVMMVLLALLVIESTARHFTRPLPQI